MTEKPDMENAGTLTPPCCLAVWSSLARTDSHGLLLLAPCNCNEKDIRSNQEAWKSNTWKSNRFKQARKLEVLHLFRWLTHTHTTCTGTQNSFAHISFTHILSQQLCRIQLFHTHNMFTHTQTSAHHSVTHSSFTQSVSQHVISFSCLSESHFHLLGAYWKTLTGGVIWSFNCLIVTESHATFTPRHDLCPAVFSQTTSIHQPMFRNRIAKLFWTKKV